MATSAASTGQNDAGNVKELPKSSEPFWFATQIAHRPLVTVSSVLILCVIFSMVSLLSGEMTLTDGTNRDFLIESSVDTERFDMINLARGSADEDAEFLVRSQASDSLRVILLYKAHDGDMLTPSNLKRVFQIENDIRDLSDGVYAQKLCWVGSKGGTVCDEGTFSSLTDLFDFSGDNMPTEQQIQDAVEPYRTGNNSNLFFFHKDFQATGKSEWIRSVMEFGLPYEGYKNPSDQEQEQFQYFEVEFGETFVIDMADKDKKYSNVAVYHVGQVTTGIDWNLATLNDFALAFGSIIFVFVYESVHTGSTFIAAAGTLQTVLAFPVTFFFYRYIGGITFFHPLHLMSVFIILGIGADDIFVFNDAWNQAPILYPELEHDIERRMAWTYRRAAKAMAVTTSTTCAAFLATALSRIMPISAFGFWAAILILVNYILVITYFPAVKVIRHKYMIDKWCWCCLRKKKGKEEARDSAGTSVNQIEVRDRSDQNALETRFEKAAIDEKEEFRWIEKFLMDTWLPAIYKVRYGVIACGIALMIGATILAASISPLTKEENWLPEDHRISIGTNALTDEFVLSDSDLKLDVSLFWGALGVDRSGTSRWDSTEYGKVIWDKEFDLSQPANQNHLKYVCESLRNQTDLLFDPKDKGVKCFIEGFERFVKEIKMLNFPVPADNFIPLLNEYILTNDTKGINGAGEFRSGYIGLANDQLRYVEIVATAGESPDQPSSVLDPVKTKFEDLMNSFNERAPAGINRGVQSTGFWSWIETEKEFVSSAIQGLLIAIGTSFTALLIATQNWLLSLYAIFTITGIVSTVMGILRLQGAEFGTAESISVVILVGLSVDYCVHLASAYIDSEDTERYPRTRDALRDLGISVVAGAITTLGSASFLWFAVGIFFVKFANIITWTVIFSLLWSLAFFVALCSTVGPQRDFADLRVLFKNLFSRSS